MGWSNRQLAIFEEWENSNNNLLISAVAGSGKTSTLMELLRRNQYKTLFLAFNKSIQKEIEEKISKENLIQGKSLTLHSLGFSAIRNSISNVKVNNGKNFDFLKALNSDKYFRQIIWKDRLKLGYTLMDMNDISRLYLTNDIDKILRYGLSMGKILQSHNQLDYFWKKFIKMRERSYETNEVEIDFLDMIYLPVYKNLFIPIDPYYLFMDEAQDFNLLQHKFIDKLINQGSIKKWVAAGDKNQSIYGFSGAYTTSFDLFKNKGNVKEMPLDICYRCAVNIVNESNKVYNIMQAFKEDNGIVETIFDHKSIKNNSIVICRNTSPLIDLYFSLIKDNRNAYIVGDDILKSLQKFLKPFEKSSIFDTKIMILRKISELKKHKDLNSKLELYIYEENYQNFLIISQHLSNNNDKVESLIFKMKKLFDNKRDAIKLMTIHKSKGLESDVVYILNEHLIPSKFAMTDEQLKQEENLKYVARTRAKKELYYLNLDK